MLSMLIYVILCCIVLYFDYTSDVNTILYYTIIYLCRYVTINIIYYILIIKIAPTFQHHPDTTTVSVSKQSQMVKSDQNFNDLNCYSDDDIVIEHPLFPFPM
jgi:hypothetical protein